MVKVIKCLDWVRSHVDLALKQKALDLDDAPNTARLTWRMIQDSCMMDVTKRLVGVGTSG